MYTIEEKQVQLKNGITVKVRWVEDENPDLSWLGEYTSKGNEYTIDRETGRLLGEAIDEPDCPFDDMEDDEYDNLSQERYNELDEEYTRAMDEWNDNNGCEVLASGLSTMKRREYRYFGEFQRLPHDHDNWAHVSQDELDKAHKTNERKLQDFCIDTGNKAKDLDVLYTCLDYERMEDYDDGWSMTGCIAEVLLNNRIIGESSVWSVESDITDEYKHEIERQKISQALHDARETQSTMSNVNLHKLYTSDIIEGME